jgi:prefoldin subunit 5
MTEQQQHLTSLLQQRQTLTQELETLQAKTNSSKELFLKVQGAIEYLNQIGVTLPETEVVSEESQEDVQGA